jgi:hypothetical protein
VATSPQRILTAQRCARNAHPACGIGPSPAYSDSIVLSLGCEHPKSEARFAHVINVMTVKKAPALGAGEVDNGKTGMALIVPDL